MPHATSADRTTDGVAPSMMPAARPGATTRLGQADAGPCYLPALDGLRAAAVLLVVTAHAGLNRVVPGGLGVTVFFAISGFLITRQLLARHRREPRMRLGGFYARRVLRLVPALLAYVVLAGGVFMLAGGRIGWTGWAAALGQAGNYYQLVSGYHSNLVGVRHPFNILWSLSVEDHFYLIWPAVLLLCLRRGRSAGIAAALAVCLATCAAVLVWRLWLLHVCLGPDAVPGWSYRAGSHAGWACLRIEDNPEFRYNRLYLATDTRLDSIAWGAGAALALALWPELAAQGRERFWRRGLAWLALATLAASLALTGPVGREAVRTTLQGMALAVLVPAVALGGAGRAASWILESRPALLVGRASYSLYLWHWGGFALADGLAARGSLRWVVLALGLAGALTAASYCTIERPMLRLRRRAGSHAPDASAPESSARPAVAA